ncbi:MAG: S-layer homology domain-containing protein [Clostridiales bacterium]|jgi:uncharacterized repeat protein (TIGR02543 family)|nr:S-layer homology domain-containing protein [Clostridiales bacterium]
MKKLKKRIAIVLVMLMAFTSLSTITALADPITAGTVEFSLSSAQVGGAPAGFTFVDVSIQLDSNPGIVAGALRLEASEASVIATTWTGGPVIGQFDPVTPPMGGNFTELHLVRPLAPPANTFATGLMGTVRFSVPNAVDSVTFTLTAIAPFGGFHNNLPPPVFHAFSATPITWPDITPTYGISLAPTTGANFGSVVRSSSVNPITITVTNAGNQATGALSMRLSGADAARFNLSATTISNIANPGGTATFTIGLVSSDIEFGTYNAVVHVESTNPQLQNRELPVTITITRRQFTVNFSTTPAAGGGTLTAAIGATPFTGGSVEENSTITFTATPNAAAGWVIQSWSGAGLAPGGTAAVQTLSVGGNVNVGVNFTRVAQNISFTPASGSTGHSVPATAYPTDTVNINAGTRPGYVFDGWTSTTTGVTFANANNAQTTFVMPTTAVTLTANWHPVFEVAFSATGNGTITATPAGGVATSTSPISVRGGTVVTFTATPAINPIHRVASWTGVTGGTGVGTQTATLTVNAAAAVVAAFEPVPVVNPILSPVTHGGTLTFDPRTLNSGGEYTPPAAQTITLSNSLPANAPITITNISEPTGFTVISAITEIAANASGTFTIQPNAGLAVGTHSEIVTISIAEAADISFNVSFTVLAAPPEPPSADVWTTSFTGFENRLVEVGATGAFIDLNIAQNFAPPIEAELTGYTITGQTPGNLSGTSGTIALPLDGLTATAGTFSFAVEIQYNHSPDGVIPAAPATLNIGNVTLIVNPAPPVIPGGITLSPGTATIGQAFSGTLAAATGGPITTWAIVGGNDVLPPGLTLSGNTISGTPTQAGVFNFHVNATGAGGTAQQAVSINVTTVPGEVGHRITFDAQGGSAVGSRQTGADGRLASLPTSSRANHTFNGWFTAATGGTRITTATVFARNTTVFAQWTSTAPGGGLPGGGGGGAAPPAAGTTVSIPGGRSIAGTVLTWNNVANAAGFVVYVDGVAVTDIITDRSFDLASLNLPAGTYEIRIRTIATTGRTNSGLSPVLTFVATEQPAQPSVDPPAGDGWTPPPQQDTTTAAATFTDVNADAWYHDYVTAVIQHGLFQGMGDGIFAPQESMTRAMFTQVLANLDRADLSAFVNQRNFGDVAMDAWYGPAVEWAAYHDIVTGVGGGNFDPGASITREQMAVMLFRFIQAMEIDLVPMFTATNFTDQASISDWAVEPIRLIQSLGIVTGRPDGSFDPQATATRAEVGTIFARFLALFDN